MAKRTADIAVLSHVPGLQSGIVKRSVKDIISEKLALLIASGVLQVGDELPSERDLASALAVSRETVRGAIQILALQGIVDVSHGARTRVASTDVESLSIGITTPREINSYDVETVHASRMLVERQIVADAADRIDDETIERLEQSLAEQLTAIDDPVRFLICDREFHSAIYQACGNPLLADFVADLYSYLMEHRRRVVSRPGAVEQSYRDHVAIVEALRAHDREAVVAAFSRHLDRIYATTKSIMSDLAQDLPGEPPRKTTTEETERKTLGGSQTVT